MNAVDIMLLLMSISKQLEFAHFVCLLKSCP